MTMSEDLNLLIAFISGLGLGTIFFYGLWWTVKKIKTSKLPAVWIFGSGLSRIIITLAGFYLVASINSECQLVRLLLCLL
jgi:F1F0 ATPase subunit 2